MKVSKLFVCALAVALVGAGGLWATQATKEKHAVPAAAKASTGKIEVATGKVVSVDDNSLTVSHKVNRKMEETKYTLTPETKREGDVENGARVTVHYKLEGSERVATVVKAKPGKKPKSSKPKT